MDGKASDRTKAINNTLGDPKCLRVDKLIGELLKLKDEPVLIYTSNVNIGTFATIAPTDLDFRAETDQKIRATAILERNSFEPVLETTSADKLQSGAIQALMSVAAIDAKCDVASIRGVADTPDFKIVKKGNDDLWLRNMKDPRITLRYQYNRVDKLTVTLFKPDQYFCGRHGGMRMIKYVVAREAAMQKVDLDRGFANAIASTITAPEELTAELSEQSAARSPVKVTLKTETMTAVRQLLNSDGFKPAVCPQ